LAINIFSCYLYEFVKDITLSDGSYPTDTILQKTWEIKNNGDMEWGNGVELVFFKGNETLALQKSYAVSNAKPQECIQMSVMIRTPTIAGRYCAYFRLQKNGNKFGPRVWVDIFVVEEPKGTEEPSKTMTSKQENDETKKTHQSRKKGSKKNIKNKLYYNITKKN